MITCSLADMERMVNGTCLQGFEAVSIAGVSTDSRNISAGNLFVPIIGDKFDGHQYVQEALSRGAAAAFWQQDRPLPSEQLPLILVEDTLLALQKLASAYRDQLPVRIIGITGSNGKTTTKDMVAAALSTTYNVHKTQGNLNNHIGLPLTLLQMEQSTEMAVVEMGMSGRGEIELLSKLAKPEAVIITNIGEAHLLQLGSREEITNAKLEALSGLKEDGLFVYNGDEPLLERLLPTSSKPNSMLTFRFGLDADNDIYPTGLLLDENGTHFTVNTASTQPFFIPLLGQHNVVNALSAIAVAKYMGVSEKQIAKGLRTMKATGMRIELVKSATGLTILNDAYNASPTSMKAAIDLLKDMKGFGRKILVLGDMLELGEREVEFHREIGRMVSSEYFDYVFTFGRLASYIAEEAQSTYNPNRVKSFTDKKDMVREIMAAATPQDVVLVKGSRGMRLEEIVNGLMQAET